MTTHALEIQQGRRFEFGKNWLRFLQVLDEDCIVEAEKSFSRYRHYKKPRGMSLVYDWFDWLGGYPFDVAKPEEIFDCYREKGFTLVKLKTCAGSPGNNKFVFQKCAE